MWPGGAQKICVIYMYMYMHYICMIQGETQQTRIITLINLSRRAADAIITNITCSAKLDLNTFGELRGLVNKCCAAPILHKISNSFWLQSCMFDSLVVSV